MNLRPEESDIEIEDLQSEVLDAEIDTASYKISSFGTDFTLEILANKLRDGEIKVPSFQRKYVWTPRKASKLIESFLLGLPVPQIFLYLEKDDMDLMVVDGQQRLKTIKYFFDEEYEGGNKFKLTGVKPEWEGKTYSDLIEQDKRKFKNSVLRATIFEQIDPQDNTSVFAIFERLNTGGMALTPQEIRNCVINGRINIFLDELNNYPSWRTLLGKSQPDSRMKDIEMILRFFSLYEKEGLYKKPMKDFISDYMKENKELSQEKESMLSKNFKDNVNLILEKIGPRAFILKSGINVALFDSLMVALAKTKEKGSINLDRKYLNLLNDSEYLESISKSTTDADRVRDRIKKATSYFENE